MFPILLGKTNELKKRIEDITPYDPEDNIFIIRENVDTFDKTWSEIFNALTEGKQVIIKLYNTAFPNNQYGFIDACFQYAVNSYIILRDNFNGPVTYETTSPDGFPKRS